MSVWTRILLSVVGLSVAGPSGAEAWPGRWEAKFDAAIRSYVDDGRLPGAVLQVEHVGESYRQVYGWRTLTPQVEAMTADTIFDVASLTKVVATTPSVMRLVEDGTIELDAPVSRYLAEFAGDGREAVTVRLMLTHNSGLPPGLGFDPAAPWSGYEEGIRRACREPLAYRPGSDFVYSDINFILLGEVVRRVSGQWVGEFAETHFFEPLAMRDTSYLPAASLRPRIAPTAAGDDGSPLRGVVHDPTARRMGGRCGHAGLFSTCSDLARYCRMLLNGGVLDGRRVLAEATVNQMTHVQSPPGVAAKRGLGWDIATRFASQRGDLFPEGDSFGHTGWTGPSLWIDPASQTFVVFVTNRNHPTEAGRVGSLRHELGTLAARSVADWQTLVLPGMAVPWPQSHELPVLETGVTAVFSGLEGLRKSRFAVLQGRRVGLITNHTGIDRARTPTVDVLANAPGVTLVSLFSPEHGLRGDLDRDGIADSTDDRTGLPVFSLYGDQRAPTPGQLAPLDTLVFDIQDIGCRFYTYVATMSLAMESAAREGKRFVVLDRPNPINGDTIAGPLRHGGDSFIAAHSIPLRHGMTIGELARLIAAEKGLRIDLHVIPCEGWRRSQWFDETGLPWINPSPNMRSLTAAALYPGIGMLEFTNLSVGRGTDSPFELVGAPWIDELALATELNAAGLAGVRALPVQFTPTASVYARERCHGLRLTVTDRGALDSISLGTALASALCRRHGSDFHTENLDTLLLHPATTAALKAGRPWPEIRQLAAADERAFRLRRRPFLLY